MKMSMIKWFICLLTGLSFSSSLFMGCDFQESTASISTNKGNPNPATTKKEEPVTLTFSIWSTIQQDIFMKLDLSREYRKVKPNVSIKLELLKDVEYENAIKIRNAAGELPDIMPLQAKWLNLFKDSLTPLDELEATKSNGFAKDSVIDGKILGLPSFRFNEFVWYRKSVFQEYNISVPQTWDEFVDAAVKIKKSGNYVPIAMGGKDAWPDYPFNSYMPLLEAGDGLLLNKMAIQDNPFSKDQPFYKSYVKIKKLYDAKVMGPDPLGVSWDQAKVLFESKQAAMLAAGQWFFVDIANMLNGDLSDIGAFLLPVRESKGEKLNTITNTDTFLTIPKSTKHPEEAKAFLNWYFSDQWYPKELKEARLMSTVQGIDGDAAPVFREAINRHDIQYITNDEGGEAYKKIESAIKFDPKQLGQEMMAGKDLDAMMEDLNNRWKEARSSLGLK